MNKNVLSDPIKLVFTKFIDYSESSDVNVSGEIKIGLKSLPFLADHGFQDMIVLPGSFYIEMAADIYKDRFGLIPKLFTNIKFNSLIIISEEQSTIEFSCQKDFENNFSIKFGEKSADHKKFSTLSIENETPEKIAGISGTVSVDQFIKTAKQKISSTTFYSVLQANANQYGPAFRNIKEIWLNTDSALCSFEFLDPANSDDNFLLNPFKLDAFTQLLSVLNDSKGRTFILNSIDKIDIFDSLMTGEVWCMARVIERDTTGDGFTGDLTVFDRLSGMVYMQFTGVRLTYLEDSKTAPRNEIDRQKQICISATFTSEPVESSLLYWNKYFDENFKIEFAPYNQVFQELLNPSSLLSTNNDGINIILLNLEDWSNTQNTLPLKIKSEELNNLMGGKARYTLPNNLEIVHLNKYETDYVYKEIFEDRVYLKHGISINDGDTVVDIGANIGLFTLFVNQQSKNAEIYSYEPSPVVYELLKINSMIHGTNVKTFNLGVSDKKKTARFTFYNSSSVFSSFNANEEEDKKAIQAVVRNILNEVSNADTGDLEDYVEELTSGRLESQTYDCQLISVSDIIKENHIEKIDLLKIDAEKSELEILKGIGDSDWKKIKQIVIEIHDKVGETFEEVKSILTQKGFQFDVEEEKFLQESGLYNIYAKRIINKNTSLLKNSESGLKRKILEENLDNFNQVLHSFMSKSRVPAIVGICERSPGVNSDNELKNIFDETENKLFSDLNDIPNLVCLKAGMFNKKYPVKDYYDMHGNELGHIPYSEQYFTAIGTSLFRTIFSLRSSAYKVIALDCDNTLWKGVCGEDGIKGIQISEPYKFLQQFMIDQIQAGMLVCLCSKNNEADVFEIFDKRDDMILKRDHLVSWKLNWNLKSENLKNLSQELNLGLDSFIFIDDNPVECGEVKINCPEVLTLQLPGNESEIKNFLNNIWAFDHLKLTEEDKKRTRMYRENLEREKYRESAMSLQDFLNGLKLDIKISEPTPEQMSRVSQLTFRTNQFNFTTIRRTEVEVNNLLNDKKNSCLTSEVSDRFGDYGLVGVLFYSVEEKNLIVDTFLLSCRVLGRGVEHKILSELGNIAKKENLESIEITYVPSPKNRPALDFIEKIGSAFKSEKSNGLLFIFPVDYLANLKYEAISANLDSISETENKTEKNKKISRIHSYDLSEKLQYIADKHNTTSNIYNEVENFKFIEQESELKDLPQPKTDFEKQIFNIWQKVLGKSNIGLNDNFFEIGGTSLKAIQLIARIKKELGLTLSLVKLFEFPTIQLLTTHLRGDSSDSDPDSSNQVVDRGKKRRNLRTKRKRSDDI